MKTMHWRRLVLAVGVITLLIQPCQAATPQQIDDAIDKAKAYLYSVQKNNNWEVAPEAAPNPGGNGFNNGNWGGLTAMAAHALLAAGENSNEPKLRPAIDLLLKSKMRMCPYALCQRDQVLQLLPQVPEVKSLAAKDGMYLFSSMRTSGEATGLYYYTQGQNEDYDHSVSQYGVLAMWACAETGYEVPTGYWNRTEMAWQHHQNASGAWSYRFNASDGPGLLTPSMTTAGVATLFITQDYVHSREGLECTGNITNPAIDKGMKWLSTNFPTVFTAASSQAPTAQTYTLYGIERIGVAGGYKYFGTHDWFKEGADWLLQTQNGNGSWGDGNTLFGANANNVPATCFALFFLTRGREPIAFNKMQYDIVTGGKQVEARWNQRPRDIAKITRWLEKSMERDLNWHVLSLKDTPADELQDAPILYLSGDRPLTLAPEDTAKLKQFVEDGGLILGNPDGNSKAFIDSFKALGTKLFPSYEMRLLPPEHPIYTHEQFRGTEIHRKDTVWGLSNGVRELMVVPTYDCAKAWQGDLVAHTDAFRISANIYLYAVGRTSFRQGMAYMEHVDSAINPSGTVKLARLDYGGNADPEPAGWRRVAALLHNKEDISLSVQTIKLGAGNLAPPPGNGAASFNLAHITGTARVTFAPAQRNELKNYVQSGGVLLIDAAGGSPEFAASMENEMQVIFPKDALQLANPIPDDDTIFKSNNPIDYRYRRYVRTGERRPKGPNLFGIKLKGRWAVLFSPQDISNGLVGRDVDGVAGYAPESATALMINIVKQCGKNQ